MTDEEDEDWPGIKRKRAKVLLAELSLIDIGRLLLSKAQGPEGLMHQGASVLEMSSDRAKLTVRLLGPKRKGMGATAEGLRRPKSG